MKIAVLAWDLLVRDRRELQVATYFEPNGPLLPIEFCRVSSDGRLTLVVDETFGDVCTIYSAPSAIQSLDEAIENLRLKEGMPARDKSGLSKRPPAAKATLRCNAIHKRLRRFRPGRHRMATTPQSGPRWRATSTSPTRAGSRSPSRRRSATSKRWSPGRRRIAEALAYIRNAPIEVETPVRDEVNKRWSA